LLANQEAQRILQQQEAQPHVRRNVQEMVNMFNNQAMQGNVQIPQERPRPRAIRDYFQPRAVHNMVPPVQANNLEIKTGLINMVKENQFGGGPLEDPNMHLANFLEVANTIKMNGVSEDAIRMRLFSFSLRDKAKAWYNAIHLGSCNTWENLEQRFLNKYFPPSKTLQLKSLITQFKQLPDENFYEAWERYKEMLRKCPQHDFHENQQVAFFYQGLSQQHRMHVDASSGGSIFGVDAMKAMEIFEDIAMNAYQWPSERVMGSCAFGTVAQVESVHKVKSDVFQSQGMKEFNESINALTKQLNLITQGVSQGESTSTTLNEKSNVMQSVEDVAYLDRRNYQGNFQHQGNFQGNFPSNQGNFHGGNYQAPRKHEKLSYLILKLPCHFLRDWIRVLSRPMEKGSHRWKRHC